MPRRGRPRESTKPPQIQTIYKTNHELWERYHAWSKRKGMSLSQLVERAMNTYEYEHGGSKVEVKQEPKSKPNLSWMHKEKPDAGE